MSRLWMSLVFLAVCPLADWSAEPAPVPEEDFGMSVQFALNFLKLPLVREEVELTSEQASQLIPLKKLNQDDLDDWFKRTENMSDEDRAKLPDSDERTLKMLHKILTKKQQRRLREVAIQFSGTDIFVFEEEYEDLEVSKEQREKIHAILERKVDEVVKARDDVGLPESYTLNAETLRKSQLVDAKEVELEQKALAEVKKILSEKQNAKWNEMRGKAVDLVLLQKQFYDDWYRVEPPPAPSPPAKLPSAPLVPIGR